jgi:cytochrome c oxidase subunit 2
MLIALVLIVLGVGSVIFHLVTPWWQTEIASNWGSIDDALSITFLITGVVYVFVIFFMAYCLYRYRYRADRRAEYDPENSKLELWLTGLTSVGVVALLTPGLMAWNDFVTVPENATEIEVVGKQWEWSYRLPGADGILGTTDTRFIDDDNTLGLDPDDLAGHDDVVIVGEDLHMPLDQPVKILLRAVDVLHDFYVPQFRAKMDMVPGLVTYIWVTPTRADTFDVLCAELCGLGHHLMRGLVVVEPRSDYDNWLQEQETFAQIMAEAGIDIGGSVKLVANESVSGAEIDGVAQ